MLFRSLLQIGLADLCFLRLLLFQHEADTMHPLFAKEDRLSAEVIGAPTLMHRMMGPGLLESNETTQCAAEAVVQLPRGQAR